jgi:hypothetical protein
LTNLGVCHLKVTFNHQRLTSYHFWQTTKSNMTTMNVVMTLWIPFTKYNKQKGGKKRLQNLNHTTCITIKINILVHENLLLCLQDYREISKQFFFLLLIQKNWKSLNSYVMPNMHIMQIWSHIKQGRKQKSSTKWKILLKKMEIHMHSRPTTQSQWTRPQLSIKIWFHQLLQVGINFCIYKQRFYKL